MAHDQLGVDEDVAAENQGCDAAVDELDGAAAGEEGGHEAEDDQHPQRAEEVGHPGCEVVFCLAGEEGQGDEDAEGEQQGLHDDAGVVEGGDDADGVGFERGEAGQEGEVGRVGFALPVGQEHEADGAEEGEPHHPAVGLDPGLVGRAVHACHTEGGGEEELCGEDGVDFADKGHADWEGGFGDGGAVLYWDLG